MFFVATAITQLQATGMELITSPLQGGLPISFHKNVIVSKIQVRECLLVQRRSSESWHSQCHQCFSSHISMLRLSAAAPAAPRAQLESELQGIMKATDVAESGWASRRHSLLAYICWSVKIVNATMTDAFSLRSTALSTWSLGWTWTCRCQSPCLLAGPPERELSRSSSCTGIHRWEILSYRDKLCSMMRQTPARAPETDNHSSAFILVSHTIEKPASEDRDCWRPWLLLFPGRLGGVLSWVRAVLVHTVVGRWSAIGSQKILKIDQKRHRDSQFVRFEHSADHDKQKLIAKGSPRFATHFCSMHVVVADCHGAAHVEHKWNAWDQSTHLPRWCGNRLVPMRAGRIHEGGDPFQQLRVGWEYPTLEQKLNKAAVQALYPTRVRCAIKRSRSTPIVARSRFPARLFKGAALVIFYPWWLGPSATLRSVRQ